MSRFDNVKIEILKDETLSKNWYHLRNITYNYTNSKGETKVIRREAYDRGNGAAILLYDPRRDTVVLVRQFRMPTYVNGYHGWLLEAPAGLLDGDDPAEAIRREVMEETGYVVRDVRFLFKSFMSPGSVTEILHFFAAVIDSSDRLEEGGGAAHEDEDIEVLEFSLADAMKMIETGDICDGKTIMLLQWAALNKSSLTL
ncbi:GDP-mannose pyrophosphatase NudK [Rhizobium rhizogenes]|uniref:GDP-mannose pyrophosphatase n=1 Tax=Rhizobium rhizogenes TaxID=359 RepID=A0AAN2A2Z6_RHIRH|nr:MULTISPECIES: NUDIX domain-containing protein [Rhizobium/Agrobacterium group]AQS62148.1 NUDIX domain-containing protein [Rhizobium rhizogenes]MBO0128120.1 NUDIX domain-containing protein [Agrobacterium sp. OT33]MCZ7442585.1 NUDIX domain-containing protein [Rhizobium rhizogenes]NSZ78577.1 NUDIX domain-containing protein [Agrobacterium tumefaciens]OAM65405.1 ADP-ribose pyrophosphatase [Rhizobium rhizogenes]